MQRTSMSSQRAIRALAQALVGQGEEHHPWLIAIWSSARVKLGLGPDEGVRMDHHIHILELGERGIGHGVQRLAGGSPKPDEREICDPLSIRSSVNGRG